MEEIIDVMSTKSFLFCIGGSWFYSNTGYVFLGLIVEQVTGLKFKEAVQFHIASPLKLESFEALGINSYPLDVARIQPLDGRHNIPNKRISEC